MKTANTIFYFLFLAIILGAFASMAQNDYGIRVISWSCYLFGLSFLFRLILRFQKISWWNRLELLGLCVLFVLFGLRAAYIHFAYVEWVLMTASFALIMVYARLGFSLFKAFHAQNRFMAMVTGVYYLCGISYLLSVLVRPINTTASEGFGGLGGLCLGLLILSVVFRNVQLVDGEEVRIWRFVRNQQDHASVLLTGFFLVSIYVGLYTIRVLPPLYTDQVPPAYIELVNQAETGQEKAVSGNYKHMEYKETLDKLLERHREKK